MKDLSKEREILIKCIANLHDRLRDLEFKFTIDEDAFDLWSDFKLLSKEVLNGK